MTASEFALVVLWVVCFLGVAALSVAEVAVIRVRRSEILVQADEGDNRAEALLHLIDDLPLVLNSILLVVLLLQVMTATIGGVLAEAWFGSVGVTAAAIGTTALLFLYAEAIPKTLAVRAPRRMALRVTPALSLISRVLGPLMKVLVWLADKQTPGSGAALSAFSEEELRALARESADAGVIAQDDAELVDRSFEFGDRRVEEVMVTRNRIAGIGADQTAADALSAAIAFGHRRLPVYEESLDNIAGVVRLRDVADIARTAPQAQVRSAMSPVLVCEPDISISALLRRMQRTGRRLCVVIDTNDRTVGIATIEDLVAELVGEIADELPAPSSRRLEPKGSED